ncbi:MAG TPA: alanine--tRNA ligase [Candidatus Avacidaminococcus intestinavium]|uniref:Alanine--tRNA ligase n=1 Tax=Candidatus Avacidaminococcus intestinavium TaxID=2840684 RepID=A0A9D1SLW9_9FIRM|nr:alanine--tRNA ligase [Candidatus Avacidaminococcus intestinavium]
MQNMTGNEIRTAFLKFFEERGHLIQPSASLIPHDDPTLLLIGAGMAPFKPFFTGKMKPPSKRITTCQKCVRTGDIENVGRTARHHTFFEMLGNFSFGDYFKKEVIPWSWEFLTEVLGIPADKLWVTIYTDDDEAFDIWHNDVGVPAERIIRLEENFWEIGSGPCGPCSEIHVDLGEERGCGNPECAVGCECDRYLEIWNLVFTQYNQNDDGTYTPLENKNIDTGAGLERLASVLQEKPSNFETDLIYPIIEYAAQKAQISFGKETKTDVSLKVIADHARSLTVMISDGVLPSNEGRGYVLRRILRRAVRHGKLIGIKELFLADAVDVVIKIFAETYPELADKCDYIKRVVEMEETRFLQTLEQGTEILNNEIERLQKQNITMLAGGTAFKLYDTFGFPWELTEEILQEHEMSMNKEEFDKEMQAQKDRARAARGDKEVLPVVYNTTELEHTLVKVDETVSKAKIALLFPKQNAQSVKTVNDGEEIAVILDVTPFHAEGGGQLGDTGRLLAPSGVIDIETTKILPDGLTVLLGRVTEGFVSNNDVVKIEINKQRKSDIARNHTATHLLHAALKKVLGEHVNQAGSYVGPDRLRFDFSHFSAISNQELKTIEQIVNEEILAAVQLEVFETAIDEAKALGAMALFGEKYGEIVRVVRVPEFSTELCGGVHVSNTAEIGLFKIVSESSSGAGIRRIEAITGHMALEYVNNQETLVKNVSSALKCREQDVLTKLEALFGEIKLAEHKNEELNAKLLGLQMGEFEAKVRSIKGVNALCTVVSVENIEALRSLGDKLRDKTSGIVVLLNDNGEENINVLAMATKEVVLQGIHSGNIVKSIAPILGGKGGGRADMAQAGGKDKSKIDEAIASAWQVIENQIK